MKGRVSAVYRAHYEVWIDEIPYPATTKGSFFSKAATDLPKVGDFVECEWKSADELELSIAKVLPRKSVLSRVKTFDNSTQVIVTNVDTVCIVMGVDQDFSIRRLERYLSLAAAAEVSPLVVLTKIDLVDDVDVYIQKVGTCTDAPCMALSNTTLEGIDSLMSHIRPGETIVLLGSSGAGKSSLTNHLLSSPTAKTDTVRVSDGKGTHTTRTRQMYTLENGAFLIDTPGMRELGVEDEAQAARDAFPEVAVLAQACKFRDCDHVKSAGCALQAAVANDDLAEETLAAYLKLKTRTERHRRTRSVRR